MSVKASLYATKFGENTIAQALVKKEFGILLSVKKNDIKIETILGPDEAATLLKQLNRCINESIKQGFSAKK